LWSGARRGGADRFRFLRPRALAAERGVRDHRLRKLGLRNPGLARVENSG
jgi:hypothetical protein